MKREIEVVEPNLFAGTVADELVAIINEAVVDHGKCSVVLSGGSTPGAVYRALSAPPRVSEVPWQSITLLLGDERWVPASDALSNARMLRESLLEALPKPGPTVLLPPTNGSCASADADAYEQALRRDLSDGVGTPRFDVVLLGLGEDGHFASVFPGSPLISEGIIDQPPRLVAVASHPSDGTTRITLVPSVLLSAKRILFLVTGRAKADIVRQVVAVDEGDALTLPARMHRQATGMVTWFLDSAAAAQLGSFKV